MYEFTKTELIQSVLWITLFFVVLTGAIVCGVYWFYKRKTAHEKQVQQLQHDYDAAILNTQIEIQDDTLKRVSQELHDNLGQQLALVSLQLYQLGDTNGKEAHAPIRESVGKAIADMRSLTRSLHPDHVKLASLHQSMLHVVEHWQQSSQVAVAFEYHTEEDIPADKRLVLFRVFQELVHNVIKHAGATTVDIVLNETPQHWQLTVADNGKGMPATAVASGIGIGSMINRLQLVGGSLQYDANEFKGTKALVTIPKS